MSFGYGVGDFFKVVELAWSTYQRCKESTASYQDIGRDVYSAHTVLNAIYNFWINEAKQGQTLSVNDQEELKLLAEGCRQTLEDLEEIHKAHKDLGDRAGGIRNRLKFAYKDFIQNFGAVRERLQQSIGALAILNATLTAGAHSRALNKTTKHLDAQAQLLKYFILRYQDFQDGRREAEPAFSQSARQLANDDASHRDGQRAAFVDIENELRAEDVDIESLEDHKDLIRDWISIVVLDDDDEQESQVSNIGRHYQISISSNDTAAASQHRVREPRLLGSSTVAPEELANQDRNIVIRRRPSMQSIATHRSRDSHWEDPAPDWKPCKLLAKVLLSKYAYSEDGEPYHLPIKRVFHHLDHTNRGWLSQSMIKTCCEKAIVLAACQFDEARLDKAYLDHAIYSICYKGSDSAFQVDLETFVRLIMSLRQIVFDYMSSTAVKQGLERVSVVLAEWFNSSPRQPPIPTYWKRNIVTYTERYLKAVLREGRSAPDGRPPPPQFNNKILRHNTTAPPLNFNLTNADYIANQFCSQNISTALTSWRSALKAKPSNEQLEYTQPLDMVLHAITRFSVLQRDISQPQLHSLDKLMDLLSLIASPPQDAGWESDFRDVRELQNLVWQVLTPIIAFTFELLDGQSLRLAPVDIKTWRKLRLQERANKIEVDVRRLDNIGEMLQIITERLSLTDELEEFVRRCSSETDSLIRNQDSEVKNLRDFSFEYMKITNLRRPKSMLKPSLYFRIILIRTRRPNKPSKEFEVARSKLAKWDGSTCFIPGPGLDDYKKGFEGILFKDEVRFIIATQSGFGRIDDNIGCVQFGVKELAIDNCSQVAEVNVNQKVIYNSNNHQELKGLDIQAEIKIKTSLSSNPDRLDPPQDLVEANIPRIWKAKSTGDGRIYFQHSNHSTPTLALWELPGSIVPSHMLVPLPDDWTVRIMDGKAVYYNKLDGSTRDTPPEEYLHREVSFTEFKYLEKRHITDNHLFYDSKFAGTVDWPRHSRSFA